MIQGSKWYIICLCRFKFNPLVSIIWGVRGSPDMQKVDLSSAGSVAAQIFDISKCWPSDCISISSLLFLRLNFAIPNLYSEVLHQSSFFVLTFASYESICKLYATFSKQKPLCLGDFAVKSFSSIHTISTNLARQFFLKQNHVCNR